MKIDIQGLSFIPALLVTVVPFIAVSIMGMLILRKTIKLPPLSEAELRGLATISSVTGALFGLIIGLIVVNLWQDFKKMQEKTIDEATEIMVIYSEARRLQIKESDALQLLVKNYLDQIIHSGWPLMTIGQESQSTAHTFVQMALFTSEIKVKTKGEEHLKDDMMDRISNLYTLRKERLYYVLHPRVSMDIWIVLSIAAAVSISTTFLFPISKLKTKIILTVAYSSMIGLIFFLIVCLNYPFRGVISIDPKAFIETQKLIESDVN